MLRTLRVDWSALVASFVGNTGLLAGNDRTRLDGANDWSSNLICYVAILLNECANDMRITWRKKSMKEVMGHVVVVGEHPMGMFPFHHRKCWKYWWEDWLTIWPTYRPICYLVSHLPSPFNTKLPPWGVVLYHFQQEVGNNTIEAWYAKGIHSWNTIEAWYAKGNLRHRFLTLPNLRYPICYIRDPHSPLVRSTFLTSHDPRVLEPTSLKAETTMEEREAA